MFKKIFVPLDGSEFAEEALTTACKIAARFESEITLIRVIPSQNMLGNAISIAYVDLVNPLRSKNRDEAAAYLNNLKENLREQEFVIHSLLIESDTPAKTILSAAEAQKIDLIVMSTHGRGGIARWVYGSVADEILRHSQSPILLIRSAKNNTTLKMPNVESEKDLRV